MESNFLPSDYFPIVLQLLAAIGFVGLTMLATHLVGPKRKTKDKLETFECGIEQQGAYAFVRYISIY